jgi:hypothetical protein
LVSYINDVSIDGTFFGQKDSLYWKDYQNESNHNSFSTF